MPWYEAMIIDKYLFGMDWLQRTARRRCWSPITARYVVVNRRRGAATASRAAFRQPARSLTRALGSGHQRNWHLSDIYLTDIILRVG
jgi:hypothetical protein